MQCFVEQYSQYKIGNDHVSQNLLILCRFLKIISKRRKLNNLLQKNKNEIQFFKFCTRSDQCLEK
jgi:hypothetical protein